MDTGGLCGSETLGQTFVSHWEKHHHQFADTRMFEHQDTFLWVWLDRIELLCGTEGKTGSGSETGIIFDPHLCRIQATFLLIIEQHVILKAKILHIRILLSQKSFQKMSFLLAALMKFLQSLSQPKAVIIRALLTQYKGGEL